MTACSQTSAAYEVKLTYIAGLLTLIVVDAYSLTYPPDVLETELKDLDVRIELIQALIPLGLEAVEEELQKEVSRLIGEKNSRKGSQIPYRRWGRQPGSACLSDKKVPIDVSRVRDVEELFQGNFRP